MLLICRILSFLLSACEYDNNIMMLCHSARPSRFSMISLVLLCLRDWLPLSCRPPSFWLPTEHHHYYSYDAPLQPFLLTFPPLPRHRAELLAGWCLILTSPSLLLIDLLCSSILLTIAALSAFFFLSVRCFLLSTTVLYVYTLLLLFAYS